MSALRIETSPVFEPLLAPCDWKGAFGGRGSGKSHFFAELAVEQAITFPGDFGEGLRIVCVREIQKDLSQSSKLLIEDKIAQHRLGSADGFKIWKDRIEFPNDGLAIFKGMNDYTAESAKSLEKFRRAWIDEAQTLSSRSLALLGPTIHRWPGSEIWASWNPTRKTDAIDEFFRAHPSKPGQVISVKSNWRDNIFWNDSAERMRRLELERYPDRYEHTYEGGYARAFEGAYFAAQLLQTRQKGRICAVEADPILPVQAFLDIGGSGAKADATAIWIVQFVGPQIRILDYIEGRGQPVSWYIAEMRERGWKKAVIQTPHDGANGGAEKRYVDYWSDAGFETERPVPNQGAGAASMRIEAVRRVLPFCFFNNTPEVEAGLDALGFYHEKKDETRSIGLGPSHDWSSHAADGFGLMAIVYEAPDGVPERPERYRSNGRSQRRGSWNSA